MIMVYLTTSHQGKKTTTNKQGIKEWFKSSGIATRDQRAIQNLPKSLFFFSGIATPEYSCTEEIHVTMYSMGAILSTGFNNITLVQTNSTRKFVS